MDLVVEAEPGAVGLGDAGADLDQLVVGGSLVVLGRGLGDRQEDAALLFENAVVGAELAQVVGAPGLEPGEVVGVVDHPHAIGLAVADPVHGDLDVGEARAQGCASRHWPIEL